MISITNKTKFILFCSCVALVLLAGGWGIYQKFFNRSAAEMDFKSAGEIGEKSVYQLLIQIQTPKGASADLKGRYERGDLVAFFKGDKSWSLAEKESFLIIKVSLTEKQVEFLMQPQEKDSEEEMADGKPRREIEKIRRYRVDLAKLGIAPDDEQGRLLEQVFPDDIVEEKK